MTANLSSRAGLPLHRLALLAPLATVVLWSGNTIVTKSASGLIEPASIAFYRWVFAFVVLTPFLGRAVWMQRAVVRRHWARLATLGILGMAVYQGLAYEAARTTSAVNMGVIVALMPLMAVLLASAMSGEGLRARTLVGALLSLVGLVILVTAGDPVQLVRGGVHIGDGLMIVAVFSNALYGVLLKRWSAIGLTIWQQLYCQIAFGTLFILPFWLLTPASPITAQNLPLILFAAIAASIAAPFFWVTGVKALGAARATLFINLLPVIVALLAWSLLGEALHAYHAVGGVIALIGVAIAL